MISVVFSAINCSETVRAAVLSTLRSLGGRGEVVFHLDPSSDDSLEILSGISDPRFRLLPTIENLGFAGGLNYAINESKYELVARMDADDICLPWRFALQQKTIEELDLDALYSTALIFGKPVRPFGLMPQFPTSMGPEELAVSLIDRNPLVHPTLLIRKSALEEIGGYGSSIAEDYELNLALAVSGKRFMRHWVPTILYRVHPKQATASTSWSERVLEDEAIKNGVQALRARLGIRSDAELEERLGELHKKRKLLGLERRGVSGIIVRSGRGS